MGRRPHQPGAPGPQERWPRPPSLGRSRDRSPAQRDRRGASRAAVRGRLLGRHASCRRPTAPAGRRSRCARRARVAHALRAPGPARARPGVRLGRARGRRHRRTSSTCSSTGSRRRSTARTKAPPRRWPPRAPWASSARRARPRSELAPEGRAPQSIERDRRAVRHHYDVCQRVLRALPRRVDDLLAARSSRAGPRRSRRRRRPSSSSCARKLGAAAGRAPARRRLRLGQLRRPRGASPRRARHGHHALGAAGRAARARAPRRPASPTASTSASGLARAARRALRRDRLDRHGRARRQRARSTPTPQRLRELLRARRPAAQPRHRPPAPRRPRGRAVLRALRLPRRRAAARLSRDQSRSSAPASRPTRRGLPRPTTPRRCATGRAPGREPRRGRSSSPGPSACASGGCTCAPRARGFETGFTRSTRCARRRPGVVLAPVGSESATVGV